MTEGFQPRPLRLLKLARAPFSEVHALITRTEMERRKQTAQLGEQRRQEAETLARIACGLFGLRRERQGRPDWKDIRAFVEEMEAALRTAGVRVEDPAGQLVQEVEGDVEVIGSRSSADVSQAVVERTDRPIVRVAGRTFRGVVRVIEPEK